MLGVLVFHDFLLLINTPLVPQSVYTFDFFLGFGIVNKDKLNILFRILLVHVSLFLMDKYLSMKLLFI